MSRTLTKYPLRRGLYAITHASEHSTERLTAQVEEAIRGGAVVIQYRDKGTDRDQKQAQATALSQLCRSQHIPLIINDDIGLAREVEAAGVHLGREDGAIANARKQLGSEAIIGVSCYNRLELAIQAEQEGADYVAFGRFFPSQSKPHAVAASSELLRQARESITVPIVAIGGISADNGAQLIEAGADLLAVIGAVFGQGPVEQAARSITRLFD